MTLFRRIFGPSKRQLRAAIVHLDKANEELNRDLLHAKTNLYRVSSELEDLKKDYMIARAHLMAVRVQDAAPRIGWEVSAFITNETIVRLKKMSAEKVDTFIQTVATVLVSNAIKGILRLREARPSALLFAPVSKNAPAHMPRLITAVIPKQHGGFKLFGASHEIVGRQDELAVVESHHVEFENIKLLSNKNYIAENENTPDTRNQTAE